MCIAAWLTQQALGSLLRLMEQPQEAGSSPRIARRLHICQDKKQPQRSCESCGSISTLTVPSEAEAKHANVLGVSTD